MPEPRLLDGIGSEICLRHYSLRTEQAYIHSVKRFILYQDKRHPTLIGEREISVYLTDLAVNRHVSASTQNRALSAILFPCRNALFINSGNGLMTWQEPGDRSGFRLFSRGTESACCPVRC